MCPLLVSRLSDFYRGIIGGMCELLHTPALVQKMHGGQTPYGIGDYLGPGQSALSFIASRSFFLIGELLLGNLGKMVVVVGNAPHDRPGFLVDHLIGNRASFLCTKAPMVRVPETNFLQGITPISGLDVQAIFCRRYQHGSHRVPSSRVHFLDTGRSSSSTDATNPER